MSTNGPRSQEVDSTTERTELDDRDERALTEYMTVLDDHGTAKDAPGMYAVVGENENGTYYVDARTDACTCRDFEYNLPDGDRTTCKHRARVAFATGERAIPAGVEDVDEQLDTHVEGEPRRAVTDGGIVDAGDEGEILDEDPDGNDTDGPTYTYHREPAHVGGAKFVRCTECERESVPADPDKILHAPDCPEAAEWRADR